MTRNRNAVDPALAALASSIPQLRIQNLDSAALQSQDILAPWAFVREQFDVEQQTGSVEVVDQERQMLVPLGKKEFQFMRQREGHSHGYLELMLVLSGSVLNRVEEESFIYQAGQGCLMSPHIRHQEQPITDSEVLFVALREDFLRELLRAMERENTIFRGATLNSFLRDLLLEQKEGRFYKHYLDFSPFNQEAALSGQELLCRRTVDALRKKQPGCSFLVRAAILGFLNDLGDASLYALQSTSSMLNHQEYLSSRIDLMIQSSHGRLRIQELEELLSYNGDYLNRLYRQQKGCSISEACRERMLRDARYLLRHSDKSVDEIMQELGVTSRGYFFAQFQKAFGMTPKEYRNLLLDDKKGLS